LKPAEKNHSASWLKKPLLEISGDNLKRLLLGLVSLLRLAVCALVNAGVTKADERIKDKSAGKYFILNRPWITCKL
jgi:hypothetical protein